MDVKILDKQIKPEMLTPATEGSAAIDLRAITEKKRIILPYQKFLVGTGIAIAVPKGHVGILAPRSGLGNKGLVLGNIIGLIDSDYRGEVIASLWNRNKHEVMEVSNMDRIAQLMVIPIYDLHKINIVHELDDTERGDGGFGSSGIK